jgi:hypothetical protein
LSSEWNRKAGEKIERVKSPSEWNRQTAKSSSDELSSGEIVKRVR